MSYSLVQLAPDADDLLLNGETIGSVVRNGSRQPYSWTAELLEDLPRDRRAAPFQGIEHEFPTLEDLYAWHGTPEVRANRRESEPHERIFCRAAPLKLCPAIMSSACEN